MKHVTVTFGALGIVVSCGSSAPMDLSIGIESDASGMFTEGPDASGPAVSVAITPSAPSICRGRCVALSASASGGKAPYTFVGSPAGGASGGSLTACPAVTTTYGVSATDSSGSAGEVQHASLSGSANVTVAVDPSCSDGGAPTDGVPADAGPPDTDGSDAPASTASWTGCEDATSQSFDIDAGLCVAPNSQSTTFDWTIALAKPLLRGQSYDVTMMVNTVVPTGPPPNLDVWASSSSDRCEPVQEVTNQTLSVLPIIGGTATVHFCATAQADASALLAGWIFSANSGIGTGTNAISLTACAVASCAGDP